MQALSVCDLLKLDVEGAESLILMNGPTTALLQTGVIKAIALEFHPLQLRAQGLSPTDLHAHLLQCGYRLDDSTGNAVYLVPSQRTPS
jgi:hypothetical protein